MSISNVSMRISLRDPWHLCDVVVVSVMVLGAVMSALSAVVAPLSVFQSDYDEEISPSHPSFQPLLSTDPFCEKAVATVRRSAKAGNVIKKVEKHGRSRHDCIVIQYRALQ